MTFERKQPLTFRVAPKVNYPVTASSGKHFPVFAESNLLDLILMGQIFQDHRFRVLVPKHPLPVGASTEKNIFFGMEIDTVHLTLMLCQIF